jgi:uncharacterized OsmC-like protein
MKMKIDFKGNRKFSIQAGDHEIWTDLPEAKGGENVAVTPSELFVASIGSCVSLFILRYLQTAGLDPEGLSVDVDWDFSEDRKSIGRIDISVKTPNAVLGARKKAVIAAGKRCTLHNTLHSDPEISINVESE